MPKYSLRFQSSNTTGKITSDQRNALKEQYCLPGTAYLLWLELLQPLWVTSRPSMTSFHPSLTRYFVLPSSINLEEPDLFLEFSCFHKATKLYKSCFPIFGNWIEANFSNYLQKQTPVNLFVLLRCGKQAFLSRKQAQYCGSFLVKGKNKTCS